jgi:hypothetical protein
VTYPQIHLSSRPTKQTNLLLLVNTNLKVYYKLLELGPILCPVGLIGVIKNIFQRTIFITPSHLQHDPTSKNLLWFNETCIATRRTKIFRLQYGWEEERPIYTTSVIRLVWKCYVHGEKEDFREVSCKDGKGTELVHAGVQWQVLAIPSRRSLWTEWQWVMVNDSRANTDDYDEPNYLLLYCCLQTQNPTPNF